VSTHARTVRAGPPDDAGYRRLAPGPGETHVSIGGAGPPDWQTADVLVTLVHVSDLHVCDAQSPARVELLDRWADPDSPVHHDIGEVGTYRPQEMLTAQVVEAMVQALNGVRRGPVAGGSVDAAVVTGDNTDNAQANELDWYLTLLEGGEVRPDSGDLTRWEGVASDDDEDDRYWHPGRERADLPRSRYGFPVVPGLLDAARAPFLASGLDAPWLAVHGNHDRLLQGTVPPRSWWAQVATGSRRAAELEPELPPGEVLELARALGAGRPAALARLARARSVPVTPDAERRVAFLAEFITAHDRDGARPPRHGFPADGRSYYRQDLGEVRMLVLDTVNPGGGWEGSLDRQQWEWLRAELEQADAERAYVVLASHHPLATWVNCVGDPTRVLSEEMAALLELHPCVVLWLNGHTHRAEVRQRASWCEVTSPSLLDWPQQGRVVELLRTDGVLRVVCTMVDHCGEAPWSGSVEGPVALAGLSRELAVNHWQAGQRRLVERPRAGSHEDRNVVVTVPDPWV
jgi:metallophosphoesterase (TIGR03767 family)